MSDDLMAALITSVRRTPCPEAWHTGLAAGLLRECIYGAKHKGWHRDGKGLTWGGKLTPAEQEIAAALRKQVAA